MTTPAPDTATKKKRAALRVFGESIVVEPGEIDNSLTYSTGSEHSEIESHINNENVPSISMNVMTPPKKSVGNPTKTCKAVSFAISRGEEGSDDPTGNFRNKHQGKELFLSKRSPMRPDLVRRTQEAIRRATADVNETMMRGETNDFNNKDSNTVQSDWQAQIEQARNLNNQVHSSRIRILALKRELSSKGSREKARRQQEHKSKVLSHLDKESQFKSMVHREHQKALREEEERRRRMSVAARTKLRANAKQGQERMRLQRIQEDMAIIGERHEASIAQREKQKSDAEARRKSFAFRNGDARRIRELYALMEAERLRKAHDDYKLTEQGRRDMDEYKRKLERDRRQSLALRNRIAAEQRKKQEQEGARAMEEEHKSYELKFAAERDVEAYKKQVKEERRKSLERRNKQGREQRLEKEQQKVQEIQAGNQSYELTRLACKDVDDYKQSLQEQRRQSLFSRGQEHFRQRRALGDDKNEQAIEAHNYFELKRAAAKDVEEYLQEMEEERRKSLAFRNQESRKIRQNEARERNKELIQEHESYKLKWAGEKDVEEYQREQERLRRESLAFRNMQGRKQRKHIGDLKAAEKEAEQNNFELSRKAAKDVEAYKRAENTKERENLAMNNAERARHAQVMQELQRIAQQKESESFALKWAGENDVKQYMNEMANERRDSLKLRGKLVVEGRKIESALREKELSDRQEDENLKAEDRREVKKYQEECAARDRHSLEFRGKELSRQRLESSVTQSKQQAIERENFELERLAHKDVEAYIKECQQRRRMSLALRAKETRKYAEWKRRKNELELSRRRQLVHGRLLDQRYAELAQQEERAREMFEAIRHTTRTSNPFFGLL